MREFPPHHPLRFAVSEFWLADSAYQTMQDISRPFPEHEAAWSELLRRVERVYAKTKASSSNMSGWPSINSEIVNLRKTDPVLLYIQQARHADEHSIQDVATDWDAQLSAVTQEDGSVKVSWKHWDRPLLPVTNRGVTYQPPREHLGNDFSHLLGKGREESVIVAEFALGFYCDFINRVSTTLFRGIRA